MPEGRPGCGITEPGACEPAEGVPFLNGDSSDVMVVNGRGEPIELVRIEGMASTGISTGDGHGDPGKSEFLTGGQVVDVDPGIGGRDTSP